MRICPGIEREGGSLCRESFNVIKSKSGVVVGRRRWWPTNTAINKYHSSYTNQPTLLYSATYSTSVQHKVGSALYRNGRHWTITRNNGSSSKGRYVDMEATALELGRSVGGTGWWLCGSIHGCSSTTHGRLLTSQSVSQSFSTADRVSIICVWKKLSSLSIDIQQIKWHADRRMVINAKCITSIIITVVPCHSMDGLGNWIKSTCCVQ